VISHFKKPLRLLALSGIGQQENLSTLLDSGQHVGFGQQNMLSGTVASGLKCCGQMKRRSSWTGGTSRL
jgi:hypothetical protein